MARRLLITSALPYANGHIHIGHLVEYIQTDIWARFQCLRGHRAVYVCADDTHGTAIMIRARQEGRPETQLLDAMNEAHRRDFAGFQIRFDHYGSTNSESNRQLCGSLWSALRKRGLIKEREVTQLFDPVAGVFLADRFVKGTCPRCGAPDQYGDSCEKCGSAYSAADLVNPRSTLSGAVPEIRSAPHLFVEIEQLHEFLAEWTQSGEHLQPEIANYLKGHFLSEPLRDWDVSRPAPYFGFEIPDYPGHYWYVWFDAPIGYMASTTDWCAMTGEKFDDWWKSSDVEIHHFIGKDITYFHALFWPAMLRAADYPLPARVHIHGFLTVNGEKMSKSKGTFILARTYLDHLDPGYLRYYYASKLGPKVDDIDLNLEEFAAKVNADIVGKVVNLASRSARFLRATGFSARYPEDGGLFRQAAESGDEIAEAYENCDFARAMRTIMALADRANEYVDRTQPWKLAKDPSKKQELQDVSSVALNLYRQLAVYLAPVLPRLAEQSGDLLGAPITSFDEAGQPLVGRGVAEFKPLMVRVDPKKVQAIVESSTDASQDAERSRTQTTAERAPIEPLAAMCSIDDFTKIDLRVARILAAEDVPEAKKLLKLSVDLGLDRPRTIFAGIKAAFRPEALVGRLVVVVANLEPRQMKFGLSEGMVVAAGDGGPGLYLVSPDSGATPGQRLH